MPNKLILYLFLLAGKKKNKIELPQNSSLFYKKNNGHFDLRFLYGKPSEANKLLVSVIILSKI